MVLIILLQQLTQLQGLLADLNTTLGDEVGHVWTNISKVMVMLTFQAGMYM